MQLRLPIPLLAGASFKQGTSAFLTGLTAVGTITAVVINANIGKENIVSILEPLKNTPLVKALLNGLSNLGDKFHNWGSVIVGSKDAFAEWIKQYLNPDGLKEGVAQLYQKLRDWTLIVYNWFRYSFLEFINNIPKMVKNWDRLRLSLFKWGTFLGGGGGSALWAMFGSGANLGQLGELMSNPKFAEMMERFGDLFNENREAFDELGADGIQEILEEYLNNPEKADKAAEELKKDQQEKKEKAEKEAKDKNEEMKEEESKLTAQEIMEKYKPSKTGNPPDKATMLGSMVRGSLSAILKVPRSFAAGVSYYAIREGAKKAIEDYLEKLQKDLESRPKKSKVKEDFFNIVNGKKDPFIKGIVDATEKAYRKFEEQKPEEKDKEKQLAKLTQEFINAITKPSEDGNGDAGPLVKALSN